MVFGGGGGECRCCGSEKKKRTGSALLMIWSKGESEAVLLYPGAG